MVVIVENIMSVTSKSRSLYEKSLIKFEKWAKGEGAITEGLLLSYFFNSNPNMLVVDKT